jgi:transposase
MLPTCYAASTDIREQRQVVRHRKSLTEIQTEIKNKIHAILLRNGIEHGFSSVFTDKGTDFLYSIDLPGYDRQQLDDYLEILNHLKQKITKTTEDSEDYVRHNPHARLLMTIPGISYYSALMIAAELGDIRRFRNAKQVTSYAGLNPSVRQSGMSCYTGHISKQGNRGLRWILVQIAHVIVQRDSRFANTFKRIANQRSNNIAYVAVARKLITVIYSMLLNNAPYFALQKAKAT